MNAERFLVGAAANRFADADRLARVDAPGDGRLDRRRVEARRDRRRRRPRSDAICRHQATARSNASPDGANRRPRRNANVVSSGLT